MIKNIKNHIVGNKKKVIKTTLSIVVLVGVGYLAISNVDYREQQKKLVGEKNMLVEAQKSMTNDLSKVTKEINESSEKIVELESGIKLLESDKSELSIQNTEVMDLLKKKTSEVDSLKKNLVSRNKERALAAADQDRKKKAQQNQQVGDKNNSQTNTSNETKKANVNNPSSSSKKIEDTSVSTGGRKITMQASAYTNSPAENGGYTTTAIGTPLRWGVVAVDPNVIPLGTKMKIAGYGGTFTAQDTGGAIKGNRIDILFNSRQEAISFGRRSVEVTILN